MSDCGVCISDEPDGTCEFIDVEQRTARKQHVCCECGKPIEVGQRYEYARGKYEGEFWDCKTCLVCAEIADVFYCNGRLFDGGLWENMSYILEEITTGCFERLKTVAAKTELQRRINESRLA